MRTKEVRPLEGNAESDLKIAATRAKVITALYLNPRRPSIASGVWPRRGKTGSINKDRVPGLRRLAVEDGEWKEAMRAVSGSIQAVSSKTYMRFYERTAGGGYKRIPPDAAGEGRYKELYGIITLHGERIVKLETPHEAILKSLDEIKTDLKTGFADIRKELKELRK
jgi:hypothetical protein